MTLQRNLSNFMNAIRSSRKQSITEFAEEIGISRSEMQQILKGTCNLRIDTVKYIADKLNVDPLILLFPSYSKSQQEFALLLLNTLNAFSKLPKEKQDEAAKLFHKLILMMEENLNVK
ncbi:MAG: helix-turn-helix domain-containing protein [Anaerovoracaceae bacterium]